MIKPSENPPQGIGPDVLEDLTRKRDALRAEGFEFECDQPDTEKGRAAITSKEAVLKALGFCTRTLQAITIIDL